MKIISFVIMLFISGAALAAQQGATAGTTEEGTEMLVRHIKITADGTGIITNVKCLTCRSSILKVTKDSIAYEQGKVIDMAQARQKYAKKQYVYVRFDTRSNEVLYILW